MTLSQIYILFACIACMALLILISYRSGMHYAHQAHQRRLDECTAGANKVRWLLVDAQQECATLRRDMEAMENDYRAIAATSLTEKDAHLLNEAAGKLQMAADLFANLNATDQSSIATDQSSIATDQSSIATDQSSIASQQAGQLAQLARRYWATLPASSEKAA